MSPARKFSRPLVLAFLFLCTAASALDPPPVAPVRPVTDDYFATAVVDPYRYLEDFKTPDVQAWMKAQAAYTRARLDAIPGRAALRDRLLQLMNTDLRRSQFQRRGERLFYLVSAPGAPVPVLYYRDGVGGPEHRLVDPAELGQGSDTHYALDYFEASWDGRHIAYGISAGGSENSVLHVLEVDSGKVLPEAIERASESVVAWRPDNRSFFYLRFNQPTADTPASQTLYNARTYLHRLGAAPDGNRDPVVFGRGVSKLDVPEGEGTYLQVAPDSRYAIAVANHNMDEAPATLYVAPLAQVAGPSTPWRKLADVADGVRQFQLRGDTFYFLSQKDAPRLRLMALSLAHLDPAHPLARARPIVSESAAVIDGFSHDRDGLYVNRRDGVVSHLSRVSFDGGTTHAVPLPFDGTADTLVADPSASGLLFRVTGWVQPPQVLTYDPDSDHVADSGLIPPSKIDASGFEAKEVFATGDDGTRVPLSIITKKGLPLDGARPTIVEGYGSYGLSLTPYFSSASIAWLEHDGVFVIAHVRGGGEYGESWHRGGMKATKMNTVLDLIACAQYLIDEHYASKRTIAALGGSAGGITVGRAFTMRPDLFSVILDDVGESDSLRMETEPNGPPNVPEFGSVSDEAGFHSLYAMSSYAHVRDGTAYPAILFNTGANDPRVAPWHMLKMAARVQAATSSDRPVLLRIDFDAGHGMGSTKNQYAEEVADQWAFALWQMGDAKFQPPAP
jgi:prolyl oligopeptidase